MVRTAPQVATRGGGDGLVARRVHFPPLSRGGCAINEKIAFLSGAAGVVSKRSRRLLISIRVAHLSGIGLSRKRFT